MKGVNMKGLHEVILNNELLLNLESIIVEYGIPSIGSHRLVSFKHCPLVQMNSIPCNTIHFSLDYKDPSSTFHLINRAVTM